MRLDGMSVGLLIVTGAMLAAVEFTCVNMIGCAPGLIAEDQGSATAAAKLAGLAYQHSDGGAERALIRASYCNDVAILTRHGVTPPDAGIACGTP
jgi:hypothetical protein